MRVPLCLGGLLLATAMAAGASAATVDLEITRFDRGQLAAAKVARADFLAGFALSNLRTEGFGGYQPWNGISGTTDPQNTAVGSFTAIGSPGSGGSKIGDGSKLQVRGDDEMQWGRYSSDAAGLSGNWLDSNDNTGMRWEIAGLGPFNVLAFFVIDAADVGGRFSIKVGDTLFADLAGTSGRLANGNIHFVRLMLDEAVENLTVELMHDRTNDGFGIDGVAMAHLEVAQAPVPPAAFLLGSGIALMGLLRRRRTLL
jgi:hypothetical protein